MIGSFYGGREGSSPSHRAILLIGFSVMSNTALSRLREPTVRERSRVTVLVWGYFRTFIGSLLLFLCNLSLVVLLGFSLSLEGLSSVGGFCYSIPLGSCNSGEYLFDVAGFSFLQSEITLGCY